MRRAMSATTTQMTMNQVIGGLMTALIFLRQLIHLGERRDISVVIGAHLRRSERSAALITLRIQIESQPLHKPVGNRSEPSRIERTVPHQIERHSPARISDNHPVVLKTVQPSSARRVRNRAGHDHAPQPGKADGVMAPPSGTRQPSSSAR